MSINFFEYGLKKIKYDEFRQYCLCEKLNEEYLRAMTINCLREMNRGSSKILNELRKLLKKLQPGTLPQESVEH
jgi:hypothetical protein